MRGVTPLGLEAMAMLPSKYHDVFSCPVCQSSESHREEFKCSGCGSHACEHLVLIDGGMVICFCCYKDDDREWPDYTYTMVADKEKIPDEP